jgi:hypothetical protein
MAKIVVGSSSLIQPLLLYPDLGPAMLDNIGGVGMFKPYFIQFLSRSCINESRFLLGVELCHLEFQLIGI